MTSIAAPKPPPLGGMLFQLKIDAPSVKRSPTLRGRGDNTLVIVLHNGEQEIERELALPADACVSL